MFRRPLSPPDVPENATAVFLLRGCFHNLVLTQFLEEVLPSVSQRCRQEITRRPDSKFLQQTDSIYLWLSEKETILWFFLVRLLKVAQVCANLRNMVHPSGPVSRLTQAYRNKVCNIQRNKGFLYHAEAFRRGQ